MIADAIPPESVTNIARRASPTERNVPEKHMPSASRKFDGIQIIRNRHATACVSPVAPSNVRSGSITAIIRTAIRLAAIRLIAVVLPASRRARTLSRAPSARETSAELAIISPTLNDVDKNRTVVPYPTPAVKFTLPSQEI